MTYYSPGEFTRIATVRYDASPNEALKNELGKLFQSGKEPDFLFHSSMEAYVDAAQYSLWKYRTQEERVRATINRRAHLPVPIGGVVLQRTIQYGPAPLDEGERRHEAVRVSLLPKVPSDFNTYADALNVFPDMFPRVEPPKHLFYASIDPRRLVGLQDGDNDMFEQAVAEFRSSVSEGIEKGLFSAAITRLSYTTKDLPTSLLRPNWRQALE